MQNLKELWAHSVRGQLCTPLGTMQAIINQNGCVQRLDFLDDAKHLLPQELLQYIPESRAAVQTLAQQLEAYFAGERWAFELPLEAEGTDFQARAWQAMQAIPYAKTQSYKELALGLQPHSSARAVGRACALNPIAIVVPCHRVTGAHGNMVGYSAGVARKVALLSFERACLQGQAASRMNWHLATQLALDW